MSNHVAKPAAPAQNAVPAVIYDLNGNPVRPGAPLPPLKRTASGKLFVAAASGPSREREAELLPTHVFHGRPVESNPSLTPLKRTESGRLLSAAREHRLPGVPDASNGATVSMEAIGPAAARTVHVVRPSPDALRRSCCPSIGFRDIDLLGEFGLSPQNSRDALAAPPESASSDADTSPASDGSLGTRCHVPEDREGSLDQAQARVHVHQPSVRSAGLDSLSGISGAP